jgi:EAL domain-containing protein (putative c-di-GMP-specific phosphodiesterase class I)
LFLNDGQIVPYYQPLIDIRTQSLYGIEVLMRWSLADENATPVTLIEAFEESGLLPEMMQYLLRQVARDINELNALLPTGLHISFNVSPSQVAAPGFVFDTLSFLAMLPLEKYRLVVEVTEEQPWPIRRKSGAFLKLQLADVSIYFDDFGTGYANLNCLEQFNVDGVKIDRLFVAGLSSDSPSGAIVPAIARLAKAYKLNVIAEGVETTQQSQILSDMGITVQQGHLFSCALSKTQLRDFLVVE